MTKTEKINDCEWKPVTLESTLLSNGIEGLIGIEELTDYSLERSNKKGKIFTTEVRSTNEKSALKRKCSNQWEESDISNIEPVTKKLKVKELKIKLSKEDSKKTKLKKSKTNDQLEHSDYENDLNCHINNNKNINIEAWSSMGVPAVIIKALADKNFYCPTNIQASTLPAAILGRRDILGAAETGSGKTLAFGIPIIKGILELKNKQPEIVAPENNRWEYSEKKTKNIENDSLESNSEDEEHTESENCVRVIDNVQFDRQCTMIKPLYALILTPTRELAIQIKDHLTQAAKYTDIKIAVVLGGMAAVKQERILNKGPEIVIATPGRLWELFQQGNSHLNQINSVRYLAIDETDRMMEKGHFQELHDLLGKINENPMMLEKRQTFVFSATLTMVHDLPDYLERKKKRHIRSRICKLTSAQKVQKIIHFFKIKNPKIVDLTKETGTAGSLTECRIACTIDHKDYYLYYFLKRHSGRTLVFCNSIGCVKRLATLFGILECKPLPLHANMQQRQRLKNLERFQNDENCILIATDVAARGLDIPNVEHVIHYQVPRTSESYVHRSGRTARAQKEGITVLMMEPSEKHNYSKLCKTLGRTHDLPTFPVVDRLLIAIKERVNIARELDKLELKCRRNNAQKGWLRKAVEDMEMILDEDNNDESSAESEEAAGLRRQLKAKKRQLQVLLSKPVFPKGFSGKYLDTNLSIDTDFLDTEKAVEVMKKMIKVNHNKDKEGNTRSRKKHLQKPKK